jgi:hypothetical protein
MSAAANVRSQCIKHLLPIAPMPIPPHMPSYRLDHRQASGENVLRQTISTMWLRSEG